MDDESMITQSNAPGEHTQLPDGVDTAQCDSAGRRDALRLSPGTGKPLRD
ncbi:MAG TPA: hypothetical protein VJZ27_01830 [Aggregatilineales bacterium]|nr:hypothetical protein [Aggregatilineales bacterium]